MYIRGQSRNAWAVLSAIGGVIAFVLSWIPLIGVGIGTLLGFLAIVTGLVGMVRPGSKGLALLGIVLGVVTILLKHVPIIRWF